MQQYFASTVLIFLALLALSPVSAAEEKATRQDCVELARKAAEVINGEGLDAALLKINDKKGPFVVKDTYAFCLTTNGYQMVGHPFVPAKWRTLNQKDFLDPHGTLVFQKFIDAVQEKEEAWVEYYQYRRNQEYPSRKVSFIMKVPGKNLIVGAGIFE